MYGKRNHKTSIDTLEIFKSVNFIESMAVKSQNAPLKNEIKPWLLYGMQPYELLHSAGVYVQQRLGLQQQQ